MVQPIAHSMMVSACVGFALISVGCADPQWARGWALFECFGSAGIRIHSEGTKYWVVAGPERTGSDPPDGLWVPQWHVPSDVKVSSLRDGGADLSASGQLAVAWRYDCVDIYDVHSGSRSGQIPCRAVAVAWSNDGEKLAYLAQAADGDIRTGEFYLSICNEEFDETSRWPLRFGPRRQGPLGWGDAWALSWDSADCVVVVSTRSIPPAERPWQTVLVNLQTGHMIETEHGDAHCVGAAQVVACKEKTLSTGATVRELVLLRIEGDRLVEEGRLPGRMPVADSRPREGVYLVWQEPAWWELWAPKGYKLELRKVGSPERVRDRFWAQAGVVLVPSEQIIPLLPDGLASEVTVGTALAGSHLHRSICAASP